MRHKCTRRNVGKEYGYKSKALEVEKERRKILSRRIYLFKVKETCDYIVE